MEKQVKSQVNSNSNNIDKNANDILINDIGDGMNYAVSLINVVPDCDYYDASRQLFAENCTDYDCETSCGDSKVTGCSLYGYVDTLNDATRLANELRDLLAGYGCISNIVN